MAHPSEERMKTLVAQLQKDPGLAEQLPSREGSIVRAALDGQDVYQIAQTHRISEEAVWGTLRNAARAATGATVQPIETGGYGSDTDSGGYGETGFGSLGNEPPVTTPEEPRE